MNEGDDAPSAQQQQSIPARQAMHPASPPLSFCGGCWLRIASVTNSECSERKKGENNVVRRMRQCQLTRRRRSAVLGWARTRPEVAGRRSTGRAAKMALSTPSPCASAEHAPEEDHPGNTLLDRGRVVLQAPPLAIHSLPPIKQNKGNDAQGTETRAGDRRAPGHASEARSAPRPMPARPRSAAQHATARPPTIHHLHTQLPPSHSP